MPKTERTAKTLHGLHGLPRSDTTSHTQKVARAAMACVVACSLVFGTSTFTLSDTNQAFAEEIDTDPQPDAFQQEVERTSAEYEEAQARASELREQVEIHQARVDELAALIPGQQKRSYAAARTLYKFQAETVNVVDFLLRSETLNDFITNVSYMNHITRSNLNEMARLNEMKREEDEIQASLEEQKAEAEEQEALAAEALAAAQAARLEAQRRAEEEARRQAEEEAARIAAEQEVQRRAAEEANRESTAEQMASEGATELGVVSADGANWNVDEATFVAAWAGRIDNYLAGSPLAGQGATFAAAAWRYGVDPRWSPAISNTESSKGLYCFQPHNAWGWGSVSWDSWEEAIDDHVRGLARGYGYTITVSAAKKYCPPNWEHWYNATCAQMEMI